MCARARPASLEPAHTRASSRRLQQWWWAQPLWVLVWCETWSTISLQRRRLAHSNYELQLAISNVCSSLTHSLGLATWLLVRRGGAEARTDDTGGPKNHCTPVICRVRVALCVVASARRGLPLKGGTFTRYLRFTNLVYVFRTPTVHRDDIKQANRRHARPPAALSTLRSTSLTVCTVTSLLSHIVTHVRPTSTKVRKAVQL
jgi:hypothetical protein